MASVAEQDQLAQAHIAGQQQIRSFAAAAVAGAWAALPHHDESNVPAFLNAVVPVVAAAQRASVTLTEAYLARSIGRQPVGVNVADLIGSAVRNGTSPAEVYRRPFVTVWSALKDGKPYTDAVHAGLARATTAAETDVQLSMRQTLTAVGQSNRVILGYRRIPDATACEFCRLVAGQRYRTDQLMPIHPHCITGDAVVWASSAPACGGTQATDFRGTHAATRRWYAGEVIVIGTAAGYELTVTPNHPILTDRGWVLAGLLCEGDSVISSRRADGVVGDVPHEQDVPARIEDVFGSRSVAPFVSVPFTPENFHGDLGQGEVDVVAVDGDLDPRSLAAFLQPAEHEFLSGGIALAARLMCQCDDSNRFRARGGTSLRGMGRIRASEAFCRSLARGSYPVLLGGAPAGYASQSEMPIDRAAPHAKAFREGKHRFSSEVQLDSVRHLHRVDWAGHVFNLVTSQGWYSANAILTHNCGCSVGVITAENRREFHGNPKNDLSVIGDGVNAAVVVHGELGPLLVDGTQKFTSEADIAALAH